MHYAVDADAATSYKYTATLLLLNLSIEHFYPHRTTTHTHFYIFKNRHPIDNKVDPVKYNNGSVQKKNYPPLLIFDLLLRLSHSVHFLNFRWIEKNACLLI